MTLTDRCSIENREVADGNEAVPTLRARTVRGELPLALSLRHGAEVPVTLRYELSGHPRAPLVMVAGGISANRHVFSSTEFAEAGWWEAQRHALSHNRHQILAIDWVGADGSVDQPLDPADQADALAALLATLHLGKAAGFIGASYGAMVGMHLAARHPSRVGALLSISAAAQAHPFASACRSLQRQALRLGETAGDHEAGIALARAMAMLTYRTPEEFGERFAIAPTIEQGRVCVGADGYLSAHGARHCRRMCATAYRRLSESIDLHRIDPTSIRVPLTLAGVDSDALVPAADVRALGDAVAGSRFHLIRSRYGHDAFLKEEGQVAAIITDFLSTLEHCR